MLLRSFLRRSTNLNRAFVLVLLASVVAATLQIRIVKADPISVSVFPPSSPVGGIITVAGINATAGAEVRIYVDSYFYLTSTVANETGGYSVDIVVPQVPSRTYIIMVLDVAEGDTASTTLTVEPRIILLTNQGGYNTEVAISGDGFEIYTDITILFDGEDVTPFPAPQTDFLGSFKSSFYVIPRPNGTYTVTAEDTWGNIASADFNVVPKIFVWPKTSGSPGALAVIEGYGFAPSVNATVHFGSIDISPYPWLTTDGIGCFGVLPFFVPDVPDGIYDIVANDTDGNMAALQFVVPSPILTLTPSRVSESSLVTARGIGFMPRAPILLYLEDVAMTNILDLMWMSPSLMAKDDGSFEYSFIMPVAQPGVYTVAAYTTLGSPPADLERQASALLTIVDSTAIDMEVNVGSMHFRGEIAEFYVKTAFSGDLVAAKLDAVRLYYSSGGISLDLSSSIEFTSTGLFRIPYSIAGNASLGTYTLVVEAHYYAEAVEAYGTASGSFLISPTLTTTYAQLTALEDQIGTVVIPDLGTIKINLTAINARLVDIQGTEATIQSDIGTLKTTTDVINAKVTSTDGNMANISSDLGTIRTQVTANGFQLETATLIVALVAAAGSMLSFMFIRRMKPTTSTSLSQSSSPADPANPVEPMASTQQTTPMETTTATESSTSAETEKTKETE